MSKDMATGGELDKGGGPCPGPDGVGAGSSPLLRRVIELLITDVSTASTVSAAGLRFKLKSERISLDLTRSFLVCRLVLPETLPTQMEELYNEAPWQQDQNNRLHHSRVGVLLNISDSCGPVSVIKGCSNISRLLSPSRINDDGHGGRQRAEAASLWWSCCRPRSRASYFSSLSTYCRCLCVPSILG